MKKLLLLSLFVAQTIVAQSGSIKVDENHNNHKITSAWLVPRVTTITSNAVPAINTDQADCVTITALDTAITSMTSGLTGTPVNFQKLIIRIKDDGSPRAITWGASFVSSQAILPTTTVTSKVTTVGLIYDGVKTKWICLAVDQEP